MLFEVQFTLMRSVSVPKLPEATLREKACMQFAMQLPLSDDDGKANGVRSVENTAAMERLSLAFTIKTLTRQQMKYMSDN